MNTAILFLALVPLAPPPSSDPQLTDLVRKLGDSDFQTREAATRELLKKGTAAIPALAVGQKNADLETAERCRQLLSVIVDAERSKNLMQLLDSPAGAFPKGLAGLERFIAITGDSKENRQLYAEMMIERHAIIEALEQDPKTAAGLMADYYKQTLGTDETKRIFRANLTQSAIFLFAWGDSRFPSDSKNSQLMTHRLFVGIKNQLAETINSKPKTYQGLKNLFVYWTRNEQRGEFITPIIQLMHDMNFPETVSEIVRIALDKQRSGEDRAIALKMFDRFGTKNSVRDIEPLLSDTSKVRTIENGQGLKIDVQLRDVALGMSMRFRGDPRMDFGFGKTFVWEGIPHSPKGQGFPSEKARETTHAMWKEFISKPENKRQEP